MKKKLHVAVSPLTNTIYCGHVLKDGRTWGANKDDVTNEAIVAVAEHAIEFKKRSGKDIILRGNGLPDIKITVEEMPNES